MEKDNFLDERKMIVKGNIEYRQNEINKVFEEMAKYKVTIADLMVRKDMYEITGRAHDKEYDNIVKDIELKQKQFDNYYNERMSYVSCIEKVIDQNQRLLTKYNNE